MTHVTHPINRRLAPFGESIFTTMSRLAVEHNAVNLGQGFPDFEPPESVRAAAVRAMSGGFSQYSRAFGLPEATRAIARYAKRSIAFDVDPDREITVTTGCTEAIAAVLLGTLNAGDEVVMLDPSYDSYAACVAMAGGVARRVRLEGPAFRITEPLLRAAFSSNTRAILFNSPHNPTGRMFDRAEYEIVARLAEEFDCLILSDEVYHEITFARAHSSIAQLAGARDRTVILGSVGKTFSCTGWKIGWAIAPPEVTRAIRGAHQFLTFCAPTPLQKAAADVLTTLCDDDSYLQELRLAYSVRRERMLRILTGVGFECVPPEGSYFILANAQAAGWSDDVTAAKALVVEGVATIPASAFFDPGAPDQRWLRFAFCKQEATMALAERRLKSKPLSVLAKISV